MTWRTKMTTTYKATNKTEEDAAKYLHKISKNMEINAETSIKFPKRFNTTWIVNLTDKLNNENGVTNVAIFTLTTCNVIELHKLEEEQVLDDMEN